MFVEEWKAKQALYLRSAQRIHRIAVDSVVNEATAQAACLLNPVTPRYSEGSGQLLQSALIPRPAAATISLHFPCRPLGIAPADVRPRRLNRSRQLEKAAPR